MDTSPSYHGYRFPAAIISHCVWLYFRFCLSFQDVQEMMLERGIEVSYETIRLWGLKFGAEFARRLRHGRGRPGDTWHLHEVSCRINGQQVYLWRAVDQDGEVLSADRLMYDVKRAGKRGHKVEVFS
jgi:putative transposase